MFKAVLWMTLDAALMFLMALWRPWKDVNRCAYKSVSIGTTLVDVMVIRILASIGLGCLGRRRSNLRGPWSHVSFGQLVYALVKGVGRALGARSTTCDDSGVWFDCAVLVFAVLAYATPEFCWTDLEEAAKKRRKTLPMMMTTTRSLSIESSLSDAAYVALRETTDCGERDDEVEEDDNEVEEDKVSQRYPWMRVYAVAKPDAVVFCFAMIFAVIAALCTSAISLWSGDALDALIKYGSGKLFQQYLVELAIIAAIGAICTGGRGGCFSVISVRINVRIRNQLFKHLLTQELGFFDTTPTGDLNSRLASDTAKIGSVVSSNVNVFSRTLVQLLTTMAFMLHTSSEMTFVACCSVPIVGVASKKYGEYVWALSRQMQDTLADSMKVAEEVFSSILTVRSLAGEKCVAADFERELRKYNDVGMRQAYAYMTWNTFNTALPNFMICCLLYYGGLLVDKGSLRSGRLVAFVLLTQSLASSFNTLADIYSNIADAFGAADKVFQLLDRLPNEKDAPFDPLEEDDDHGKSSRGTTREFLDHDSIPSPLVPAEKPGSQVDITDVHFRFPSRPDVHVLQGVTLSASPGSIIALTGPSGSGKSSILKLVQYFYVPERGSVKIDGIDVQQIAHAELHRKVGLVGQEPVLFARSIDRNVRYGLEATPYEPSSSDVAAALKMAHAYDFIQKLPDNLDTDVGERGATMSGGQKQRIAIARALARKPSILLLDEATSALDAESERNVQSALDDLIAQSGLTVLVVAHRLSTIRNADSICCMCDGRIVEQGTHDALMERNGVYHDLVHRQQGTLPSLKARDSSSSLSPS